MKKSIILGSTLIMMLGIVGCGKPQKNTEGFCSAGKSISVNYLKETAYLHAVNFYDEMHGKVKNDFNGTVTMISNSYNTTCLTFEDEEGRMYSFKTDKALYPVPDVVKIFTNSKGTTFDTYKRNK